MTIPYEKCLYELKKRAEAGGRKKLSLELIKKVAKKWKDPQFTYPTIHVAGTNGKGSVSYKIAKSLSFGGYKTGLFSSPHISSFRERISIDGKWIEKETFSSLFGEILEQEEEEKMSFFEIITLLAFCYFSREKVDIAVFETGLGGRLDATNILHPILTVITSISKDHTNILGSDLESIAKEKAGIIKEGITLVVGPFAEQEVIKKIAKQKNAPIYEVPYVSGFYDKQNSEIARYSLDGIKKRFPLDKKSIEKGIFLRPKCRFETLSLDEEGTSVDVILDVAHNPSGISALFEAIKEKYPDRNVQVVMALSENKEINHIAKIISYFAKKVYLFPFPHSRLIDPIRLHRAFFSEGYSQVVMESSVSDALFSARNEAKRHGDILVVCGSFFIMAAVRKKLGIIEDMDIYDLNEKYQIENGQKDRDEEK